MKVKEKVMEIVFLVAACVSILAVLLICVFLFSSGIPAIGKIGPLEFLGGTVETSAATISSIRIKRKNNE